MKKIFSLCAIVALVALSGMYVSYAQAQDVNKGSGKLDGKLHNPLQVDSVQQLIPKLVDIVAQVGLVVCTFFIIYAGFTYVTAGGDPGKVSKAHGMLLWAVVGTAVLLGAKVLADILANTVNQVIK